MFDFNDKTNNLWASLILENIMKYIPGHVYWKNVGGVYLGCNDKQAQTLGLQFGRDVIGKTDFELPWPSPSAKQFYENDQRIMQSGKGEAVEEIIDNQGSTVFSIKAPIKAADDEVLGILGISVDISEKKYLEQLQKEKEIAVRNAEIMNILSGSIAHEVRTPLAVIQINVDLISMSQVVAEIKPDSKKKNFLQYLKNITQAIKECSQVIDMLLVKLRKITVADLDVRDNYLLETCSIKDIIETALSEYPFREEEKKEVHYHAGNNFKLYGHIRLIKHVLFNLLKNALFTIKKAEKGEIFIESRAGNDANYVIFRDTAMGIEPEFLPKIFQKFETMDETHSGTGLGLAFCKLVMESLGGGIECHSEFGKFTEFVLSFPLFPNK